MTDEEIAGCVASLVRWEGISPCLYLDTRGNPTIGVGFLVASEDKFASLPMRHIGDGIATDADKRIEYRRVKDMIPGHPMQYYWSLSSGLHMSPPDINAYLAQLLHGTFVPGLVKLCPFFESFPSPAKEALVDMAWNLGLAGLAKFRRLLGACNQSDWGHAANECAVSTSRKGRNDWRRERFLASKPA